MERILLAQVMVQWRAVSSTTEGEELLKDIRNCHILKTNLALYREEYKREYLYVGHSNVMKIHNM